MAKIILPIKGMHCRSCEVLVSDSLKKVDGVHHVKVSCTAAKAEIEAVENVSQEELEKAVNRAGYQIGYNSSSWLSTDWRDYRDLLIAAAILAVIMFVANWIGLFDLAVDVDNAGFLVALMVGLVAGVSTCMALVGGLVLGLSSSYAEDHPEAGVKTKIVPHLYFNLGRIIGFGLLGGLIGYLGTAFRMSGNTLGVLTIIVGGVMIFLGLKLIEIFPALHRRSISLPASISKKLGLHKKDKKYSHRNALTMGALTFFLPCGFTQAMQLYAVSTGSFVQGGLVMMLFALGTTPGLLGIGSLASVVKGKTARLFFMTAGLLVIFLGIYNITNASQLISFSSNSGDTTVGQGEVQIVNMTQDASGYTPNILTVKKGRPVKWIINSTNPYTCASSLIMREYNINIGLKKGENVVEFTPTRVGEIKFSCSMGMYTGKFIVVDSDQELNVAPSTVKPVTRSGGCGGCGGGVRQPIGNPDEATVAPAVSGEQIIKTTYTLNSDIQPNAFKVKKGLPVRLEIAVKESGQGCMSSITVPGLYDKNEYLQAGQTIVMEFTPEQAGDYQITCAMGVPRGVIKVVS